jgi:hypothetical protein
VVLTGSVWFRIGNRSRALVNVVMNICKKVKLSPKQVVEAYRVVRC